MTVDESDVEVVRSTRPGGPDAGDGDGTDSPQPSGSGPSEGREREAWQGILTGAVLALVAVGYAAEAATIRVAGARPGGMTARDYPLLLAGIVLLLAVALLLLSVRRLRRARRAATTAGHPSQRPWRRPTSATVRAVGALALTVAYVVLLGSLGFLVATVPYLLGLVLLCREQRTSVRRVVAGLVGAVVTTVVTYLVFDSLLGVYLPVGLLDLGW